MMFESYSNALHLEHRNLLIASHALPHRSKIHSSIRTSRLESEEEISLLNSLRLHVELSTHATHLARKIRGPRIVVVRQPFALRIFYQRSKHSKLGPNFAGSLPKRRTDTV